MKNIKMIVVMLLAAMILPISVNSAGDLSSSIFDSLSELGYTSIGLKQNIENEFEVTGKINGKHNITMILRFYWTSSFFDKETIENMGIETFETGREYSINGDEEEIYAATIDSLTIGDGKIEALDLSVVEYESYDALEYTRAKGILGRDFLLKYQAIIDYGNQRLFLKTK
jgi:predicted aspartyl protease